MADRYGDGVYEDEDDSEDAPLLAGDEAVESVSVLCLIHVSSGGAAKTETRAPLTLLPLPLLPPPPPPQTPHHHHHHRLCRTTASRSCC